MNFRLANRNDWTRLKDYVSRLPWQRDGLQIIYRVTVDELKSTRSLQQNARLWSLYTEIAKQAPSHMGGEWHSPEVWHEYLCRRFLGMVPGPFGEGVRRSTARLNIGEFGDYMTEVETWASEQFEGFDFTWNDAA